MKKKLYWACILVLGCIFLYSAFRIGSYAVESYRAKQLYDDLQQMADSSRPTRPPLPQVTQPTPAETSPSQQESTQPTGQVLEPELVTVTHPVTGEPVEILPEYSELFLRNPDLVGWLEIPDTRISYPVTQSPNNPNFYLKHNFEKKYDEHGCIYARETCDIFAPSDNITLYGHRMRDEGMFAQLGYFTDEEFLRSHPFFYFDTLQERHTYQIFAVFATTAALDKGFAYHHFENASDAAEFDRFVAKCKELADHDTGVTPQYGDKLLCLSTCDYLYNHGRLVVAAVRIS